ncbi:4Fe-4S binding protein, partial [candidate division KSB1 bacterium]|nr:4Fe-4S binding protein [candidate division KSB1 bacterium]
STWLALKKRSRPAIFIVMLFSLSYFGFYRQGCVCSVGAVQNITQALFDSNYAVPLTVSAFFALPLIFALFFGRIFCASVCPLGAIQDVVILKPYKIPFWLSQLLSLLPYMYLALSILFAVTGAAFIICRYDPFVGIFRFSGHFHIILLGASILIIGLFIARPYCRFLCPYGVLLNWFSRLSARHVSITPDDCIQCRLCEESCPFDAIDMPTAGQQRNTHKSIRSVLLFLVIAPVIIFTFGWGVSKLYVPFSRLHRIVSLAEQIRLEDTGKRSMPTDAGDAFRSSGKPTDELYEEALEIRSQFRTGSWMVGLFLGLVVVIKLIRLTFVPKRIDYTANKGHCLSCGRCFKYCPKEHERLGKIRPASNL